MEHVDSKQLGALLRTFGDALMKGKTADGREAVDDVLGEGVVSADLAEDIAGTIQIAMETTINADYTEDELSEYLKSCDWARDDKEKVRAFAKWWKKERDAIHFARLRQSSIKPLLEDFKWNIIASTTPNGSTVNHCRISLTIRQPNGEAKEVTFTVDEGALQHLAEVVTQIETSVSASGEM